MITPFDQYDKIYRNFHIYPGYINAYQFVHDDYDGAPDANDNRCGDGKSFEDCKRQIDEYYFENLHYRVITQKTITKFTWLSEAVEFVQQFGGIIQPMLKRSELEFDSI